MEAHDDAGVVGERAELHPAEPRLDVLVPRAHRVARVALAGVRRGVVGDPLLEEVAEHDPGGPVGAQHGVAGADDLERAVAVGDRGGPRPVERARVAAREGLRALALHSVGVALAPARLVGDDLAVALDERVDAVRQWVAAVIDAALGEAAGHGPGVGTRGRPRGPKPTSSVPTRVPTHGPRFAAEAVRGKEKPRLSGAFWSAPDRIRTCDLRFRRPTLYPAELRARARLRE